MATARRSFTLTEGLIAFGMACILLAVAIVAFVDERRQSQTSVCRTNLMTLSFLASSAVEIKGTLPIASSVVLPEEYDRWSSDRNQVAPFFICPSSGVGYQYGAGSIYESLFVKHPLMPEEMVLDQWRAITALYLPAGRDIGPILSDIIPRHYNGMIETPLRNAVYLDGSLTQRRPRVKD